MQLLASFDSLSKTEKVPNTIVSRCALATVVYVNSTSVLLTKVFVSISVVSVLA